MRGTLSPQLEAAFVDQGHIAWLRAVITLPGKINLRAASLAAGLGPSTMNTRPTRVERAVGFRIIERTQPLTPTPRGAAFIHDTTQVLRKLDDAARATRQTGGSNEYER